MTSPHEDDRIAPAMPQNALDVLKLNYEFLNRKYRAGGFEDIVGKVNTWRDEQDGKDLSLLSDAPAILSQLPDNLKISFQASHR